MKTLVTYKCKGVRFVAFEDDGKFYTIRSDKLQHLIEHKSAEQARSHAESMWHNYAWLN